MDVDTPSRGQEEQRQQHLVFACDSPHMRNISIAGAHADGTWQPSPVACCRPNTGYPRFDREDFPQREACANQRAGEEDAEREECIKLGNGQKPGLYLVFAQVFPWGTRRGSLGDSLACSGVHANHVTAQGVPGQLDTVMGA